ncbi:hypothetical protein BGW39_011329, partial [Mortierella sp. 14UC]
MSVFVAMGYHQLLLVLTALFLCIPLDCAGEQRDATILNATAAKDRQQQQLTSRLKKDKARYYKQLATRPSDLTTMMSLVNSEEVNIFSRMKTSFRRNRNAGRSRNAALVIRRQETEAVDAFRSSPWLNFAVLWKL